MSKLISYGGKLLADKNGHVFKYGANSGTVNITTNGTHDVNGKEYANVNVPTGTPKTDTDITVNGPVVSIPAGLYANNINKSVTNIGTFTRTTPYGESIAIPEGYHDGTGSITGGTFDFSGANIDASKVVSGYKGWNNSGTLIAGEYSPEEIVTLSKNDVTVSGGAAIINGSYKELIACGMSVYTGGGYGYRTGFWIKDGGGYRQARGTVNDPPVSWDLTTSSRYIQLHTEYTGMQTLLYFFALMIK